MMYVSKIPYHKGFPYYNIAKYPKRLEPYKYW